MSPVIECIQGEYQGKRFPVNQNVLTIGRGSGSQILLKDTYISRSHATLYLSQSGYAIRDENSRIGTFVNGKQIKNCLLRSGDQIKIGNNVFRFVNSSQAFSQPKPSPVYEHQPNVQKSYQAAPQSSHQDYSQPQPNYSGNQAQNYQAPEQYDSPPKDRVTAILLAFFLGGVGAHKLYLGEKNKFIIFLLFCWTGIPAILALIDGITYLGMNDTQFRAKYH